MDYQKTKNRGLSILKEKVYDVVCVRARACVRVYVCFRARPCE